MAESAIVIDRRYRGFERVAQGGYTSGVLAGFLEGTARVSLRGAVPMGHPLWVRESAAGVALCDGAEVLAEATRTELDFDLPLRPSIPEVEAASRAFPGHEHHPFPQCFCCGPARDAGDGLRIFPGRVPGHDAVAATWRPGADVADGRGFVRPEVVWASLDCPQLWALMHSAPADSSDRVVTAAMEAHLRAPVKANRTYAIVAWPFGGEGRRLFADAALLSEGGEALAVSRQTAVLTEVGVPLGLARLSAGRG
jgi:hypothetical protein